jgi:hypothetical protein
MALSNVLIPFAAIALAIIPQIFNFLGAIGLQQ